jgi:hypothetical protein
MHQPFGVNPPQRVMSDVELACVIAQHDGVAEELVRLDAAPQGSLDGDLNRIRRDVQLDEAEPIEMDEPCCLIGKACLCFSHQLSDQRRGQGMLAHVAISRVVEHVIGMARAQQFKEIQPAFGCTGAEPEPAPARPIGAKISVAFADTPVYSWVAHAGVV